MTATPVTLPIDPIERARAVVRGSDFAELARLVRARGLLRRRHVAYLVRIALTVGFYAATWVAAIWIGNSWYQLLLAVVMGTAFTQVAFLGHDSGHQQIFASRRANDVLGRVLANLLLGLSYGWWLSKHNRHHANPNREGHDPDIGEGALSFTTTQAARRRGPIGRFVTAYQAWLFFPLLTLEGMHLHAASVVALRPGARRSTRGGTRAMESVLLVVHLVLYVGALLLIMSPLTALLFVVIHQGTWGFYMGCSFAPNHKGMPILGADEDVCFLRRQVLTSRNVRGGPFTDLLLGGLNYQIEHHLFPNMPRPELRHAQPLVRAYCAELGITYCETSLLGSYGAALAHLHAVGAATREARG